MADRLIPTQNTLAYLMNLRKQAHAIREDGDLMLRPRFVEGRGSLAPDFLFVAIAPRREDEIEGRPFVGKTGNLLEAAMREAGIRESRVWMTTILKFRPAQSWAHVESWQDKEREPTKLELDLCSDVFRHEVDALRPHGIVALGNGAAEFLYGGPVRMLQDHGNICSWRTYGVVCTHHPAYLLHRGMDETSHIYKELVRDLKRAHGFMQK